MSRPTTTLCRDYELLLALSHWERVITYLTDQKVRGAHDSIKTSTPAEMLGWGPRPWGGAKRNPGHGSIKKGEPAAAGGSRCDCKKLLADPLPPAPRAWIILRDVFPGAHAPGFTLTCAPRTQYGQSSM